MHSNKSRVLKGKTFPAVPSNPDHEQMFLLCESTPPSQPNLRCGYIREKVEALPQPWLRKVNPARCSHEVGKIITANFQSTGVRAPSAEIIAIPNKRVLG